MDEDEDLSNIISKNLRDRGVEIINNVELDHVKVVQGGVICFLKDTKNNHSYTIEVEHCLYSIGRIPNTKNLNLESIGVKLSPRGGIETKEDACSNVSHIFASGS